MSQPAITIYGGHGGVTADLDDMMATAPIFEQTGAALTEIGVNAQRYLADPDVVASAILDPGSAAHFEKLLLEALDGPHGLMQAALSVAGQGLKLQTAAQAYEMTDRLTKESLDGLHWFEGATSPIWGPYVLPVLLLHAGGSIAFDLATGRDHDPMAALNRYITDHPGLIQEAFAMAPGLVTMFDLTAGRTPVGSFVESYLVAHGKNPFPLTAAQGASLIAVLYPDGKPHVDSLGVDNGMRHEPPRGLGDLMDNLRYRGSVPDGGHDPVQPDRPGQIDVMVIEKRMPDGTIQKSYVVDIPGTRNFMDLPGQQNPDLNDMATNIRALGGDTTSYELGIKQALAQAGASRDAPVMLVGHSQGGIVAMRAAHNFVSSGDYNVTNVVTAGAPVADISVPSNVQVLSIQNSHDIVPHLTPHNNPDQPNWTTVTVDQQNGGVLQNHSVRDVYQPAAQRLDAGSDPSVAAFKQSAAPFFDGDQGTTYAFQVSRQPT